MRVPLQGGYGTVTLNAQGGGQVLISPQYADQVWFPTMANVSASSNNLEPVFKAYQGKSVGQNNYIGGTYTGSNDMTDLQNVQVYHGDAILGVWTNGDPGAIATLILIGEMEIP